MAIAVGKVEAIETIGNPSTTQSVMVGKHGHTTMTVAPPIIFSLNNQVVCFDGTYPVIASPGDELVVAGAIKADGILHATAYENLTRAVGRTGVMSRNVMLMINASIAGVLLFFGWVILAVMKDEDAALLGWLMFIGIVATLGLGWYAHYSNKQMAKDAAEIKGYARHRLGDIAE